MRKLMTTLGVTAIAGTILTACSNADEGTVITVAATSTPMTDVVETAAEVIEDGYTVEMLEFADVFPPNVALDDGEVDANFIQHPPHMEDFNEGNEANLVVVEPIYYVIGGMYSREHDSLDDLPDGATVSIPNDSNQGRALDILQEEGLITLADGVERFEGTEADVVDNPKNLEFVAIALSNANVSYEEVDVAYLLSSYARQLEMFPDEHALATDQHERFAVSLIAREDNHDTEAIEALQRAFVSDQVRETLEELDQPAAF